MYQVPRTRTRRRRSALTGRYRHVSVSRDERQAAGVADTTPRLQCLACGALLWGSGLGIGAHERGDQHNAALMAARRAQGGAS